MEYGRHISYKIPGVTAILGSAADYAELVFAHLITGQQLFGKDFNYRYTITSTSIIESKNIAVGSFDDVHGLTISCLPRNSGDNRAWAAPLIVPISAVVAR